MKQSGLLVPVLLCSASLLYGCMGNTDVWVGRQTLMETGGAAAGGRLAVLLSPGSGSVTDAQKREERISACLAKSLRSAKLDLHLVSTDEFRRAAFPDNSFDDAVGNPDTLTQLLAEPKFQERIAGLDLRYIVAVWDRRSDTNAPDMSPLFAGKISRKHSELCASIIDLRQARAVEDVQVYATGEQATGVQSFFLPIVALVFPEHKACAALGDTVAGVLANTPVSVGWSCHTRSCREGDLAHGSSCSSR